MPSDPVAQLTQALEEAKGEKEIIVSRALVIDALKALAGRAEAGQDFDELRAALKTATVNERLLRTFREFWMQIRRPGGILTNLSEPGMIQIIKDAVAAAQVSVPTSMATPSPDVIEIGMITLLRRIAAAF